MSDAFAGIPVRLALPPAKLHGYVPENDVTFDGTSNTLVVQLGVEEFPLPDDPDSEIAMWFVASESSCVGVAKRSVWLWQVGHPLRRLVSVEDLKADFPFLRESIELEERLDGHRHYIIGYRRPFLAFDFGPHVIAVLPSPSGWAGGCTTALLKWEVPEAASDAPSAEECACRAFRIVDFDDLRPGADGRSVIVKTVGCQRCGWTRKGDRGDDICLPSRVACQLEPLRVESMSRRNLVAALCMTHDHVSRGDALYLLEDWKFRRYLPDGSVDLEVDLPQDERYLGPPCAIAQVRGAVALISYIYLSELGEPGETWKLLDLAAGTLHDSACLHGAVNKVFFRVNEDDHSSVWLQTLHTRATFYRAPAGVWQKLFDPVGIPVEVRRPERPSKRLRVSH